MKTLPEKLFLGLGRINLYLDQNKRFSNVGLKLIEGIKYRLNYSDEDEQSFSYRFLIWKSKFEITSQQYEKYIT